MATPTISDAENLKRDIDDLEALVNGSSSVATRTGGIKPSYSQLMSGLTHGIITAYNSSSTYTLSSQWVSHAGVVYRPIPEELPITPTSPLSTSPDSNKWLAVQISMDKVQATYPNRAAFLAIEPDPLVNFVFVHSFYPFAASPYLEPVSPHFLWRTGRTAGNPTLSPIFQLPSAGENGADFRSEYCYDSGGGEWKVIAATRHSPNLFHNPAFQIQQRVVPNGGATFTQSPGNVVRTADRWFFDAVGNVTHTLFSTTSSGAAASAGGNALSVDFQNAVTGDIILGQIVDVVGQAMNPAFFSFRDFGYGNADSRPLVLSFWAFQASGAADEVEVVVRAQDDADATPGAVFLSQTVTILDNTVVRYQLRIPSYANLGARNFAVLFRKTASSVGDAPIDFFGMQLEVGAVANSFNMRPYGEELAACLAYYEYIGDMRVGTAKDATESDWTTTEIQFSKKLSTPTCTVSAMTRYTHSGLSGVVSTASATQSAVCTDKTVRFEDVGSAASSDIYNYLLEGIEIDADL